MQLPPAPGRGTSAPAPLEQLEEQVTTLRSEWEKALADSLSVQEMGEQIDLLKPADRDVVKTFTPAGELPEPVSEDFVSAVSQVLARFEVRRRRPQRHLGRALPRVRARHARGAHPSLHDLLDSLTGGASADRIRDRPRMRSQTS